MKKPILVLKMQEYGKEPTEGQAAQRDKFKAAAKETKKHFEGTKLKGADRVRAMNAYLSELLKS